MKQIIIVILLLTITGCAASGSVPSGESPSRNRVLATQGIGTSTPLPTATIGYQQTAIVAKQTSDEAMRINVQVTAEYDQMRQEQIRITESAEARSYQRAQWTATAALTAIPLTATQQAANSTVTVRQQALLAGQMTQTKEAPAQMVAMQQAENMVKYSFVDVFVKLFAMFSLGVFLLSISAFTLRYNAPAPVQPVLRPMPKVETYHVPTAPAETVIQVRTPDPIYPRMDRMVVPCASQQFDALVTGVLSEGKSLAINQWEGKEQPFTRDEFTLVRNWLLSNRLAQSTGQGALTLSAEGEGIFIEWLNSQTLPQSYKFTEAL